MSNLPQETIDKITIEANAKYKDHGLIRMVSRREGYIDGATEWTAKAQGPISTLELLSVWLNECKKHGKLLDVNKAISVIEDALAKYKEVSNG